MTLKHGSLFAGIGGFDLGFWRAGIETMWQVEIDPYCRRVLDKNFPIAGRYEDIRECGARNLATVDRRLTPTECETLQGFPKDWTVPAIGG